MLSLAIISFATAINAQNLSLGPTAGFGHAWATTSGIEADKQFHGAYNIGGKLVYSFMSHWGVSADVKFSGEGVNIGNDQDDKIVIRANYLRIPLQGIYFFGDYGQAVRPKISLGPSFGFLTGGKTKLYEDGEVVNEGKTKDVLDGFDFGLTGAVGANFRIAEATWLNADIAYYHGLTNTAKSGEFKNRNIGINIGVLFPLGTVTPAKK